MLSAILEKAGFSCDIETSIGADSFDTSAYKTLIIGVGGSQKGLGAAGWMPRGAGARGCGGS